MTAAPLTDPAPPPEEEAPAPTLPKPGVPAPAAPDVRGKAAGRAQVGPPRALDGSAAPRHSQPDTRGAGHDAALLPPVVRAVAAVPGALSLPGPPPEWPPIPLAPPGLPGRPPTERRRAFTIRAHDFFDVNPAHERRAGRAAPADMIGAPGPSPDVAAAAVDGEPLRVADFGDLDDEVAARVDGTDHYDRKSGAVGRGAGNDAGRGFGDGRPGGGGGDADRPRVGERRPAAGALVELRRPRRPGERERDEPQVDGSIGGEGADARRAGERERDKLEAGGSSGAEGVDARREVLRPAVPFPGVERPETGGRGADRVRKKRLRQTALPVVAAGVAAFVVGSGYLALSDRDDSSDLGRWGGQAAVAPVTVAGSAANDPFGQAKAVPAGAPSRLRVKAIGVDTSLDKLHLGADGALVPPTGYKKAGWYSGGTAPGDVGPAVIAGHVDSKSGPAVFYRLRELTVGDRIEVVRGGATVRFTVVRTAWYPKTNFPTSLVYGPTPDRQLRLITCGGVFDHRLRSYKDNFVVYAVAG